MSICSHQSLSANKYWINMVVLLSESLLVSLHSFISLYISCTHTLPAPPTESPCMLEIQYTNLKERQCLVKWKVLWESENLRYLTLTLTVLHLLIICFLFLGFDFFMCKMKDSFYHCKSTVVIHNFNCGSLYSFLFFSCSTKGLDFIFIEKNS